MFPRIVLSQFYSLAKKCLNLSVTIFNYSAFFLFIIKYIFLLYDVSQYHL